MLGLGYIGLPTSIVFAEAQCEVVGFDIDHARVAKINLCDPVISEPEVFERLRPVIENKQFRATTVLENSDCFIIAVPTPITTSKQADLSYVWQAAKILGTQLKAGDLVILESTVPVGTTQKLQTLLHAQTGLLAGQDYALAFSPERVLPGKIFHELQHNHRIVGGIDQVSGLRAQALFKKISIHEPTITDSATAELVKLVENSARDSQLAFAYQVASMARTAQCDPYQVIALANMHPRVKILTPTCGVGGHCLAVDPWFLVETFPAETGLLKLAREINDQVPAQVLLIIDQKITALKTCQLQTAQPTIPIATNPTDPTTHPSSQLETILVHITPLQVLVLGLTYKANSDDLRESPAIKIALELQARTDITLTICEPYLDQATILRSGFTTSLEITDLDLNITKFDLAILLVGHTQFKQVAQQPKIINFSGLI